MDGKGTRMRVGKACGFDSNGVCDMYTTCKEGEECDDWEASLISFYLHNWMH